MPSSLTSRDKFEISFKRFKKLFSVAVLPLLFLVAVFGLYTILNTDRNAQAATCTWSGANSGDFSDPGNWSSCPTGSGVPEEFDEMYFPSNVNEYNLNNDLGLTNYGPIIVEPLNSNNYYFSGGSIDYSDLLNMQGSGSFRFIFDTNVTFCSITGSGDIEIISGSRVTSGCGNNVSNSYSGGIYGSGTFAKEGGGIQDLNNTYIANGISVESNGTFLQFTGNGVIDGNLFAFNNSGTLFNNNLTINGNFFEGGNINVSPGSNLNTYNYYLNSGNVGIDVSNGSAGQINVAGNTADLSSGTFSMRFFGTYSVGQSFTVLTTSGGGQLGSEFFNFPTGNTIEAEGWGPSSVINDVILSVSYSSTEMIVTIDSIESKTCGGNKIYSTSSGTVISGSLDYLPNSDCSWLIAPSNADSVTLDFTALNTESGADIVKVYDGVSPSVATQLGEFSGTSLPGSLTAESGVMLITFTSNGSDERFGFAADWSTVLIQGPTISSINPPNGPTAGGTGVVLNGSNFQSGQYQNVNTVGSADYDGTRGLVVDSTGQYIAGEFSGTINLGPTTLTSTGGTDVYIAKLDNNGDYVWAVKAGGTGGDGMNRKQGLADNQTDDTIMITGYYSGNADFGSTTLTGGTGANIFIAKVDKATGSFVWAKGGGGNTSVLFNDNAFPTQTGTSIDVDGSGNIYFSGHISGSSPSFGGQSITLQNSLSDRFVAKLNSSGDVVWINNYGDTSNTGRYPNINSVSLDSAGNVYLLTNVRQSITIGSTTITTQTSDLENSNIIVAKFDNSGNVSWAISGGTVGAINTTADLAYGIDTDSNDNVYITGYFGGQVATFGSVNVAGSRTGDTTFVARIDPSGSWEWVQTLSSSGFATARDMFIDDSDNIWIGGVYASVLSGSFFGLSGAGANAFFAKYDTTGDLIDLRGIGGTAGQQLIAGVGGNQVRALYVYNNKLYIAGEYFDTVGIGGQTLTSAGNQDGFFTTWVSDKVSVTIGGIEVEASGNLSQLSFTTPPNTAGFKDVVVTSSSGQNFTLTNGFEYQAPSTPIINSDIASLVCSPTLAPVNTTVNCVITTNVNLDTLSGSVNVRIGAAGNIVNCPVTGTGTTLSCNNVPVGSVVGIFTSQYNASGSGTTYLDGNDITVEASGACTGTPSGPTLDGETVIVFCVDSGALTLYPGDATDNNDLCETGNISTNNYFVDDGGILSLTPFTCSAAEQGVTFSPISVSANRQNVTTTIYDILFEDLTGSEDNTYTVNGTISNLVNQNGGSNITLGSNPDGASLETALDPDAPSGVNGGKLYCTIDPSTGTVAAIVPTPARTQPGLNNLIQGPKTTIFDTATSISIFNTSGNDVLAGRYDIDGVNFKCRIPAYVDQGTYKQNLVLTVIAS